MAGCPRIGSFERLPGQPLGFNEILLRRTLDNDWYLRKGCARSGFHSTGVIEIGRGNHFTNLLNLVLFDFLVSLLGHSGRQWE